MGKHNGLSPCVGKGRRGGMEKYVLSHNTASKKETEGDILGILLLVEKMRRMRGNSS